MLFRNLLVSLFTLVITLSSAQAASVCKGLSKSACESSAMCGFVKGYTKKDGSKVNGYCRTKKNKLKDAKSSLSAAASEKKKDAKATTDDKLKKLKSDAKDKKDSAKEKKDKLEKKVKDKKESTKDKAKSKQKDAKKALKDKASSKY